MAEKRTVRYTDADFEETVMQWYEDSEDSDADLDNCNETDKMESEHDSLSELSGSEDDEYTEDEAEEQSPHESATVGDNSENQKEKSLGKTNYFGKNRFRWSSQEMMSVSRTKRQNIIVQLPGLKGPSRTKNSTVDATTVWNFLFDDDILQQILLWTNARLSKERVEYKEQSYMHDVDIFELRAFIGLLFFTAVFKSNREDYRSLFATDGTGRDIFRCVMSKNRFGSLLAHIRFDNPETRLERRNSDPAAAISEIFAKFIHNCQSAYSVGSAVCVDEMLVSFRGRVKFKMYMPNKPAKYGIKLMCATDARTNYLYSSYIYTGKDSDGVTLPSEEKRYSKPTQAVLRLCKPFEKSNRNVTADNWFTSIELVNVLRERGLTYVGTLKKNKREIPREFLPAKARTVDSSLFGFANHITLLSHVPKKNKAVLLVSSMHYSKSFDEVNGKPEIITYYNSTKSGVDTLDQKCANYSTGRRTQRWLMAVFYRLLDISANNAYVLYNCHQGTQTISRFNFISALARQLVTPHIQRRHQDFHLSFELRACIRRILGIREEIPQQESKLEKRKTCYTCDPKKKRKTYYLCHCCQKPVCLECTNKICHNCTQNI